VTKMNTAMDSTNKSITIGACTILGGRNYQEDRIFLINDFNSMILDIRDDDTNRRSLFCVFDGNVLEYSIKK